MNATPSLSRCDFEELVREHEKLIRLANDLEFELYRLGERPAEDPVSECQQAAGALISSLRNLLFRHDQAVLPVLDALTHQHHDPSDPQAACCSARPAE